MPCLFLSSSDAIAPGREIWVCPKKIYDITVEQHGSDLASTAVRAGVQFMQLNSRCMEPATPDEIPPLFPMYLLKIMPKSRIERGADQAARGQRRAVERQDPQAIQRPGRRKLQADCGRIFLAT